MLLQVIQAKKASDHPDHDPDVFADITMDPITDHIFLHDYEYPSRQMGSFYANYPAMDDMTGMSFVYDTTSFLKDSPLDFLGGSSTNYSRIGSLEGFGSVENFSLDDFK